MDRLLFYRERCKGCELCVSVCPVKIIKMDDKLNRSGFHPAVVSDEDLERCISCGLCAIMCPDVVIEVYRPLRDGKEKGATHDY